MTDAKTIKNYVVKLRRRGSSAHVQIAATSAQEAIELVCKAETATRADVMAVHLSD